MTLCSICQEESEELLSIKPCKHEFHLYCIKKIVRPFCPLCKTNITKFLVTNQIISKQELLKRCDKDDIRIINDMDDILNADEDNHTELSDASFDIDGPMITEIIDDLNNQDNENIVKKCLETLSKKENEMYDSSDWCEVYRTILYDKIYNAHEFFDRISTLKKMNNIKGIFLYNYDSVEQFIKQQIYNEKSICKFTNIESLEHIIDNAENYEVIKSKIEETNDDDVYIVVSVFRYNNSHIVIDIKEVSDKIIDDDDDITTNRPSRDEIIASLFFGENLRYEYEQDSQSNTEFKWAKNYFNNLRNNIVDKIDNISNILELQNFLKKEVINNKKN